MTEENPVSRLCAVPLPAGVQHLGERRVWGRKTQSHGLLLAILFLASLMGVIAAEDKKAEVTVLVLLKSTNRQFQSSVVAYREGFISSLWSRNYTTGEVKIKLVHKDVTLENIAATIEQAVKDHPDLITVVGPTSAPLLLAALPALQASDVVAFAPLTDALSVRFWTKHFYFFVGDTRVAVFSLLRYAVTELRATRVGYMYLTNASYGDGGYILARNLMADMESSLCGLFVLDSQKRLTSDDAEFMAQWEQFAETRPQAVIIMGILGPTTASFVRMMLTDSRTKDAWLLCPPRMEELLLSVWKEVVKGGKPFVPGQVTTSGSNPSATDTSYECIKRFQGVMLDYLTNSGSKVYNNTNHHLTSNDGEMMVAGWMAGEILVKALYPYTSSHDRAWFIEELFDQRRYIIDDFVVGDFGGDISRIAEDQGAMRRCNQGGNICFIKRIEEGFKGVDVPEARFTVDLDTCYNLYTLYNPVHAVVFELQDIGPQGAYAVQEILRSQLRSLKTDGEKHAYRIKVLPSKAAEASRVLELEKQSLSTDIVLGVILDDMLKVPDLLFVDPWFPRPRRHTFMENIIMFQPTMEQELFVVVQYLSTTSDPSAHVIVRSSSSSGPILDVVQLTFESFGVTLQSTLLLDYEESLEGKLPASGLTIVLGTRARDVQIMAKHLEENKNARLFLQFLVVSVLHPNLRKLFYGEEISDRVLLATNLPHWEDPESSSALVSQYHATITNSTEWSPLSLANFAASKVIQYVIQEMDLVKPSYIADYLYSRVMITVDDMTYGPYANSSSIMCNSATIDNIASCAKNYGATSISVWSLTRVFDHTVPALSEKITPSMVYVKRMNVLTTSQIIGIVLGSLVGLVLLIALPFVLFWFNRDSRDNNNAPKDPMDPVTLVFTDIESSTALWAACPDTMPDAVASHHRLIRSLIAKYHCYEVKTIGDSFMIASKHSSAAVQLIQELQQTFLQHNWGTSVIDDSYHKFEEDRAAEDDEYQPPTARLDDAEYRKLWNGLRVRAGLHTGLCDIRYDEVTKGYDYYGSTSNMAARTESVANGGQVLLTRAAYLALTTAERAQLNVTELDAVPLRGVPAPVEMYQLDAVPGRSFAALRLERDIEDEYDEYSSSDGSSVHSGANTLNSTSGPVATAIMLMFSSFPLKQRMKAIQPLLQRWNVRVPSQSADVSHEDHLRDVVVKLAIKLGRVLERRGHALQNDTQSLRGTLDLGAVSIASRDTWRFDGQGNPINLPDVRRVLGSLSVKQGVGNKSSSNASITVEARWPFRFVGLQK